MTVTDTEPPAAGVAGRPRTSTPAVVGPRLSTVFTSVFALGGIALGIRRLHDNSFLWHLRTGEYILDHGIPHADPYSWSAPGTDWVAQSWLAELLYGIVNAIGGGWGLRLLGATVGACIGVMLFRIPWRLAHDRIRAAGLGVLAMFVMLNVWSERPLMLGILAMLGLVAIVELEHPWASRHLLVSIPVVMWLWVNVHGTWVFGFAYLALHLLGRWWEGHRPTAGRERDLLRASLIAGVATLLNPYGIKLVLFPLQLMGRSSDVLSDVDEWQPPDFRELGGQAFGLLLLVTLAIFARKVIGRRDLLVAAVFVAVGLYAIRNVGLSAVVLVPILARAVRREEPAADPRAPMHRVMLGFSALILVLILANAYSEPNYDLDAYPVAAFAAVREQGFEGRRLVTTDDWGGYLIAEAYPDQKVFYDDRYDMYPLAVSDDYTKLLRLRPGWEDVLERRDAEIVMWRAESTLADALAEHEGWHRIYADDNAVVYVRDDVAPRG